MLKKKQRPTITAYDPMARAIWKNYMDGIFNLGDAYEIAGYLANKFAIYMPKGTYERVLKIATTGKAK